MQNGRYTSVVLEINLKKLLTLQRPVQFVTITTVVIGSYQPLTPVGNVVANLDHMSHVSLVPQETPTNKQLLMELRSAQIHSSGIT